LLTAAHLHAQVLRRIEGADVFLAALGEIVGVAAIEILVDVRREEDLRVPAGGPHETGAALQDLVEQQAIVGRDVLHVAHVLVAALDLERTDAGVDQRFQVAALVVVLHRQQVLVVGHDAALAIRQGIRQPARLGTVAAVGAAARVRMRDIALPGKRDAQGAMDEVFERRVHLRADLADLVDGQLACQHQLGEADVTQEFRLLHGADVALRAGVQLDRRQVEFQQPHVLDDQRIDARLVQLPDLLARQIELGVVHDRVHRDEDAGAVAVRELHQAGDLFQGIAGIVAGAEGGAADIDGVGAMQDRLAADLGGFGGRQQFELVV
jgi:3-hydroxymyristoyl/3-hydroxydecanoyl-(acyl carrier protein) dehydratase